LSVLLPALGVLKTDFYLYYPDSAIVNARTWIPAFWALAWLAAILACEAFLIGNEKRPNLSSGIPALIGLTTLAVLVLPLAQIVKADRALTVVDSRETARVWIEQNLPAGSRIAVESYAPFVDPIRFSVEGSSRLIQHDPEWYLDQDLEYLIFSQRMFMRFYRDPAMYESQIAQYDRLFERFELFKTFNDGGYEVRLYKTS
jgi:hypothetical protein